MPVGELLERTSSRELTEYGLLFGIQAEERALARDGLTPDEIADVIANRGERPEGGSDGEPGLLESLLPEEARAERQRRLMELEDAEDEDSEDSEDSDNADG